MREELIKAVDLYLKNGSLGSFKKEVDRIGTERLRTQLELLYTDLEVFKKHQARWFNRSYCTAYRHEEEIQFRSYVVMAEDKLYLKFSGLVSNSICSELYVIPNDILNSGKFNGWAHHQFKNFRQRYGGRLRHYTTKSMKASVFAEIEELNTKIAELKGRLK